MTWSGLANQNVEFPWPQGLMWPWDLDGPTHSLSGTSVKNTKTGALHSSEMMNPTAL